MTTLVTIELHRQSHVFCGFIKSIAVFGHHVPIVESMCHQHRGFHLANFRQIIARCPKFIVITRTAVHAQKQNTVAHETVVGFALLFIARVHKIIQNIHVFAEVTFWSAHQAIRAVIVIKRRYRRNWNDGFQSFNTRCGSCNTKCSIKRRSHHAHFSAAPKSLHFFVACARSVAFRPAAKPIDDRFGGQGFIFATNRRHTIRQTSSRRR